MNIGKENGYMIVAKMEKLGYTFEGEKYPKLLNLFFRAGLNEGGMIPAVILTGVPGAGKTFMAEAFAEAMGAEVVFYQCTEATNASTLIGDINPAEVVRGNAAGAVAPGAMVKTCMAEKPCVLILDEWDKGDASLDAFLLDFLQSRRVRDMNGDMQYAPSCQIWVFLTSNEERPISDALRRRVRQWEIPRMSAETVADILGVSLQHPLMRVWEGVPNLALSQLQSYINDVGTDDIIDTEVLGQYIELPENFVVAKDKTTTTVVVETRCQYVDIDVLATTDAERITYVNSEESMRIGFQLKSVVDWLSFASKLKSFINPEAFSKDLEMDLWLNGTTEGYDGFIVPIEALRSLCDRVVVHPDDHVAVITKTRRIYIGELKDSLVYFQEGLRDIFCLTEGGNENGGD
jgi:predicted ATPase